MGSTGLVLPEPLITAGTFQWTPGHPGTFQLCRDPLRYTAVEESL